MIRSTGGEIKATTDVPDMLNAASVRFRPPLPRPHGRSHLIPQEHRPRRRSGFMTNSVTYPGQPVGPNAETLHEAFEGRELIELDFGARFAP